MLKTTRMMGPVRVAVALAMMTTHSLSGCYLGTEEAGPEGTRVSLSSLDYPQQVAADIEAALEHDLATDCEGCAGDELPQAPEIDADSQTVTALEVTNVGTVELALPETDIGTVSQPQDDLTVFVGDSFSTAVLADTEGAFRALVHLESPDAPADFAFEVSLAEGGEVLPLEDGGAAVRDASGELLATIASPWARDANGLELPSYYEIHGSTLVQHIDLSQATAYPVVADPFFIPLLGFVGGQLTRHALIRMGQRKISKELVEEIVKNGASRAGNRGTTIFSKGKGGSRVNVVVDNRSGNIITVFKG